METGFLVMTWESEPISYDFGEILSIGNLRLDSLSISSGGCTKTGPKQHEPVVDIWPSIFP